MIAPSRLDPQEIEQPPAHIVQYAIEAAVCSPCQSKRGAAIFLGNDLVTTGYNFKPRAFACDGSDACKATCRIEAVHAEQVALLTSSIRDADMLHVKVVDGKVVPSGDPSCVACSKLIYTAGIRWMWLFHEFGWQRYSTHEFHLLSLQNDAALAAVRREAARETQTCETCRYRVRIFSRTKCNLWGATVPERVNSCPGWQAKETT